MTKSDILKEEMLLRVFQRLDYTGHGRIKIDEFSLVFEAFNLKVPNCDLYTMFNIADKDQSGDLSFNEFKSMLNDIKIQDIYKGIIEKERVE